MSEELLNEEQLQQALMKELNGESGVSDDTILETKSEQPKVESKQEAVKPADDGKEKQKASEDDYESREDGNPYKKRIDRLLRKSARIEQEKEQVVTEKDAEIARLKAELESKTAQSKDEDEDDEDIKPKKKAESIEEAIDRRLAERDKIQKLEKADQEELDDLFKEIPGALDRKNEILELSRKHPTLSFSAIDQLLAPEDHVDPIELNRKNARNMGTGTRSKADLANEPDPNKMSTNDLKKTLDEQIRNGSLVL